MVSIASTMEAYITTFGLVSNAVGARAFGGYNLSYSTDYLHPTTLVFFDRPWETRPALLTHKASPSFPHESRRPQRSFVVKGVF